MQDRLSAPLGWYSPNDLLIFLPCVTEHHIKDDGFPLSIALSLTLPNYGFDLDSLLSRVPLRRPQGSYYRSARKGLTTWPAHSPSSRKYSHDAQRVHVLTVSCALLFLPSFQKLRFPQDLLSGHGNTGVCYL